MYKMVYCDDIIDANGYKYSLSYLDLDGNVIKKTPFTNPYDFDDYVEWKGDYKRYDSAVYSDRLYQWDITKYRRCYKEVFKRDSQVFYSKNPERINMFLNMYFGNDVELTAIVCGCNSNSGFPYWVFFYRELKQ